MTHPEHLIFLFLMAVELWTPPRNNLVQYWNESLLLHRTEYGLDLVTIILTDVIVSADHT